MGNLKEFISKLTRVKKQDPNLNQSEIAALQKAHIEKHVDSYKNTFSGPEGEAVLEDLAKVCGFLQPVLTDDPVAMGKAEGKREVFLHIIAYLEMDIAHLRSVQAKPKEGGFQTSFKI